MPLIFIRHAHKQYNNGDSDTHPYDPPIVVNELVINNIEEYKNHLIQSFGTPSVVMASPYLRTRQTAHLLGYRPSINSSLSEYISAQHGYLLKK